jgi:hypothetical protein
MTKLQMAANIPRWTPMVKYTTYMAAILNLAAILNNIKNS